MSMDLALPMIAMLGLSVLAYRAGLWIGSIKRFPRRPALAISLVTTSVFGIFLTGRLFWAVILPIATVIVIGNLIPILLSWTAGLASSTPALSGWTRVLTVKLLAVLTVGFLAGPLVRHQLAPADIASDSTWIKGVCLQSHESTCAPSAAATLLRTRRIESSERELVELCLTSEMGTEPLGLFRGLAVACQEQPVKPRVASSDPGRWVDQGQVPNVALIRFGPEASTQPSFPFQSLGRFLGPKEEGHAVTVLGQTDANQWIIADPAFGRTVWSNETFLSRFTGDAVYLAPRDKRIDTGARD